MRVARPVMTRNAHCSIGREAGLCLSAKLNEAIGDYTDKPQPFVGPQSRRHPREKVKRAQTVLDNG